MKYRRTRKAWNVPHQAHALTFSVSERRPFLLLAGAADAFLNALDEARHELRFELWAYVVMPEHVHLVLNPTQESYTMESILSGIKKRSAKAIFRIHPQVREACRVVRLKRNDEFRFWMVGGGYDRNLYSAQEAWEKIHYAHDNPVRRGLCEDPREYLWSSLRAYRGEQTTIAVDPCPWSVDS
ncbi:hypothetical protein EON82_08850 [bacterium]|nr:MAG: hypothetical protein EON82_08850 [bacterium]